MDTFLSWVVTTESQNPYNGNIRYFNITYIFGQKYAWKIKRLCVLGLYAAGVNKTQAYGYWWVQCGHMEALDDVIRIQ